MSGAAHPSSDLDGLDARARERDRLIRDRPGFARAPRLPAIFDLDAPVWPLAAELAREDGALGFAMLPAAPVEQAVKLHLGAEWRIQLWDVHNGEGPTLLERARTSVARGLPEGWRVEDVADPSDAEIAEIAALNTACGVSPNPPCALRGLLCPIHTVAIRDSEGLLRASASAQMLFPDGSRLEGVAFIGLVSVDPDQRGMGLGHQATAHLILRSAASLGWKGATAWVASDNPASLAMIGAAGFTRVEGIYTTVAMPGSGRFTR